MAYIKFFHVLGAIMFFGSVLDHVAASQIPGLLEDEHTLLVVRQYIGVSADYVTMPGLVLLLITGPIMVIARRPSILKVRWLGVHMLIAVLITLNVVLIMYPVGQAFLDIVAQGVADGLSIDKILVLVKDLADQEATFGPLSVLCSVLAIFIAVIKPRFGRAAEA